MRVVGERVKLAGVVVGNEPVDESFVASLVVGRSVRNSARCDRVGKQRTGVMAREWSWPDGERVVSIATVGGLALILARTLADVHLAAELISRTSEIF